MVVVVDHARQGAEHHHAQVVGLVEHASSPSRNPRGVASPAVNAGMPAAKAAGSAISSCIAADLAGVVSLHGLFAGVDEGSEDSRCSTGVPQLGRNQTADGRQFVGESWHRGEQDLAAGIGTACAHVGHTAHAARTGVGEDAVAGVDPRQFGVVDKAAADAERALVERVERVGDADLLIGGIGSEPFGLRQTTPAHRSRTTRRRRSTESGPGSRRGLGSSLRRATGSSSTSQQQFPDQEGRAFALVR